MRRQPVVMRQKSYICGLEAALDVIGAKWKVLILWALRSEAQRFGELRRLVVGISEKMLIQHLKEMQADGIVARKDFKEVPPRVEYALTPFGTSLYAALAPLCEWGELHMKRLEVRKEPLRRRPARKRLQNTLASRRGPPIVSAIGRKQSIWVSM